MAIGQSVVAQTQRQTETLIEDDFALGYPSVAAAFEAVKAKPNIDISAENDWTYIFDDSNLVRWDFTQTQHPGHPTVVKRLVELPTKTSVMIIRVSVLCEAQKTACEKVRAEIAEENYHLR